VLEHGLVAALLELSRFGGTDLVDGFAHVGGDVKAVEHVHRLGRLARDDVQVGLPHVAADEQEARRASLAELAKEAHQRCFCSIFADPKQPSHTAVN
jgi:hypothetical protein